MKHDRRKPRTSRHQRGFSLIVSLILLVLIMLVALGSMRAVALQSRISATTYDRNLALQAAETAVRDAEALALAAVPGNFPASLCTGIFCAALAPTAPSRWVDASFTGWVATASSVSDNAAAPDAIIEHLGESARWPGCMQDIPRQPNCPAPHYRITARSTAADRATVVLQTDVLPP